VSERGAGASLPDIAVDTNGDAVVVWIRAGLIQARARSAAGTLSAVQTLSGAGQNAVAPQVAVDANGDALVVWGRFDGTTQCGGLPGCLRIQTRSRSASGTFGTVQTLSSAGQSATQPQVAIDPNGNAVFAWRRSDGTNTRVEARARSAAGTLGAVQLVSPAGQNAMAPQVGIDSTGDAVLTWARSDGTNTLVQARGRSAAGTLGTVQTLSGAGQNAVAPQVAVDANGDALVVWGRFDGTTQCGGLPGCLRIQTRSRSASGTLGTVQTLSAAGQSATEPQVGIDSTANAVFAWTRFDGTKNRVQARARSAAGALSVVQTLSAAGQDAIAPQVADDANGDAAAVWQRFDGTTQCGGLPGCYRVQAAAGP